MTGETRADAGSVKLIVDRDSVCMADDVESHRQVWELPGSTSVAELLSLFATNLLPSVSGFAGWRVYQDIGERGPGWTLGVVYTRDHLRQERYVCLAGEYPRTVADLAGRAPALVVQAAYLSRGEAQPHTLHQIAQTPNWTGAQPVVLGVDAQADAEQDRRLMGQLNALIKGSQGPRRSWVRHHLHTGGAVASGQLFAARNMRLVTHDLCPAAMIIAARDLLGRQGRYEDVFADIGPSDGGRGLVAAVFGAFEWGLSRPLRSQAPPSLGRAYLDYLGHHGYRLSPVDQFLAGHLDFAGLRNALHTNGA